MILVIFVLGWILATSIAFQFAAFSAHITVPKARSKLCSAHTPVLRKSALFAQADKNLPRKQYDFDYSIENDVLARIRADISDQDNFYETVYPKTVAKMKAAKSDAEKKQIESDFDNLMYAGYLRNLKAIKDHETGCFDDSNIGAHISMEAAEEAYRVFEIESGLSKIKPRVKRRAVTGPFTPPDLMIRYLKALRKNPGILDILKNTVLAAPFLWGIFNLKGDFLFRVASMFVGECVLFLSLLLRGCLGSLHSVRIPLLDVMEVPAMRTALLIHFAFVGAAFTATSAVTRLFMLNYPFQTRLLTSMSSVLVGAGLAASLFEVFEPLDKKGYRFEQVLDEEQAQAQTYSEAALDANAKPSPDAQESVNQMYDFEYDPDEDEDEGVNLLEVEPPKEEVQNRLDMTEDDYYEHQANAEYEQFLREMKQARREITGEAEDENDFKIMRGPRQDSEQGEESENEEEESEDSIMGVKKGFLIDEKDAPAWVIEAVDANQPDYARVPRTFGHNPYLSRKKVPGPKFFRDKTPKWLEPFIMEDKVNVDDELLEQKRQYGSYRKAMHMIDKGVVLQPCDTDDYELLEEMGRGSEE